MSEEWHDEPPNGEKAKGAPLLLLLPGSFIPFVGSLECNFREAYKKAQEKGFSTFGERERVKRHPSHLRKSDSCVRLQLLATEFTEAHQLHFVHCVLTVCVCVYGQSVYVKLV